MKEESHFYSFILTLCAFVGFVLVFAYNLYLGNGIDHSLLKASFAAFFTFLPLKGFIYYLEKARNKPVLKDLITENEKDKGAK